MFKPIGEFLEQLFIGVSSEVDNFDCESDYAVEEVFAFSNSGHRFVN